MMRWATAVEMCVRRKMYVLYAYSYVAMLTQNIMNKKNAMETHSFTVNSIELRLFEGDCRSLNDKSVHQTRK